VLSTQRFAPGTHGGERVGLGAAAARRPVRPIELDDQFAAFGQEASQSGAIAASALDRPRPKPRVSIGHRHQLGVSVTSVLTVIWSTSAPVVAVMTAAVWVCL